MKIFGTKTLPFPWRYIWIGALVLGGFQLSQQYADHLVNGYEFPFSWYFLSVKIASTYLGWIVLTPLVYWLSSRCHYWLQKKSALLFFKILALSLLVIIAHVVITTLLIDGLYYFKLGYVSSWMQSNRQVAFVGRGFASLGQYVIFLGFFLAFVYYQKYVSKKQELDKARLDALLMQLHPHFLFNTLHSIASLIDWDAKAAQKMIVRLGELLRKILSNEDRHLVRLEEEFRFLEHYLGIEKIRFQDRLDIQFDIAENTLQAQVPNLVLQPLVENAIKHGLGQKESNGFLKISSQRINRAQEKAELELKVEDNGKGFVQKNKKKSRQGVGLANVRKRLEQHYNADYYFDVDSVMNQGCTVTIRIPYKIK